MKIRNVIISEEIENKILEHGVTFSAIESVFHGNSLIIKAKYNRYIAVGLDETSKCLTTVFEYQKGFAKIITAYPLSTWQIKLYKRKKKRKK